MGITAPGEKNSKYKVKAHSFWLRSHQPLFFPISVFARNIVSRSFFFFLIGTIFFFFFSKSRDLLCTRNLHDTVHTIRKSTSSMPDSAEIQEREMQIHVSSSTFFFSINKKQKSSFIHQLKLYSTFIKKNK
jgi:hypothetical protein